jgi:hypothetical protein
VVRGFEVCGRDCCDGAALGSFADQFFWEVMFATMQQQQDDGRRARRKSPLSELGERLAYQLRNAEVGSSRKCERWRI